MKIFPPAALAGLLISIVPLGAPAQTGEENDLSLSYGDPEFVSIATGRRQPISRAPAIASVLTRDDLDRTGATTLSEALEMVPGMHVAVAAAGYNPIFTIRGVYSEFNPQVLVLINGIPITNIFFGNRSQAWASMPVEAIERIEVIRGPGSALYGADAYAGVINITTMGPEDFDGTELGARGGSFDRRGGWVHRAGRAGPLDYFVSVEAFGTDGHDRIIREDAQTQIDEEFCSNPGLTCTDASLAPGPVNVHREGVDARLELVSGHWRVRGGYQGRYDAGVGAGSGEALDPVGEGEGDRYNVDLTYDNPGFSPSWGVTSQLAYFDVATRTDLQLFPPGAFDDFWDLSGPTPAPGPDGTEDFPNGVLGNPYVFEQHYRFKLIGEYKGFAGHRLVLGTGVEVLRLDAEESKNFFQASDPDLPPIPFDPPGVRDVTNDPDLVFIAPHERTVTYALVQDEWSFAPDWDLTTGVRYDHFTDFGDTVNPRVALVWQTRYNLTTKILYGRAFRAPAMAELFAINNPVSLGNPDLDPETIDTLEIAFDYQYSGSLRTGLNVFAYEMDDIIRFESTGGSGALEAQNTGRQTGYGLEWEMEWKPAANLSFSGNYAFQRAEDERVDKNAGNAPRHQVFLRGDWEIAGSWNADVTVNWVGERERVFGDPREPVDDYTWINATLRHQLPGTGLELAGSVRNALDDDAREPSLGPVPDIPDDLPLADRHYFVELSYGF